MKTMAVKLSDHSYGIHIGSSVLTRLGEFCRAVCLRGTAAVITNPTVRELYGDQVVASLESAGFRTVVISIPDGECFKNAETLTTVYDQLIEGGIDRGSFVVALGGGVVGDLAGFAAASYLRGIPFVQVPTTLLAQVDSSVGGKTGIDHPCGKNLIGAFYQPKLVLADVTTLRTLSPREFKAGLAEVIKYGVIFDEQFFSYLEEHMAEIIRLDAQALTHVISRCCELKAGVVERDEKETSDLRAVLNFGHTLGHAFETAAHYQGLLHGEAVAIGMVLAATISLNRGYCTDVDVGRIKNVLVAAGLPVEPPRVPRAVIEEALLRDKKGDAGIISFICNQGIGDSRIEKIPSTELCDMCELGGS